MNKFDAFVNGVIVYEYKEVESDYLIGGDTDSIFLDLSSLFDENADLDEVCEFADDVASEIMDKFPQFLGDIFNVPEERRGIIQTDREVVSDKSIFLGKKKYIMNVLDKEGKRDRFTKIMGCEIIKTDTPIIVQDMLLELTKHIMEGKKLVEIDGIVASFRDRYYNASPLEIGVPTTMRNLDKYIEAMIANEKAGRDKLYKIPRHAKGCIFYNSKCSDGTEIKGGSKVKLCYVNGDKTFDTLALPADLTSIPDEFGGIEVDYNRMWSKVMDKINIYLAPLKDIENRKVSDSAIVW